MLCPGRLCGMSEEIAVIADEKIDDYIMRWVGRKPISEIATEVGLSPNDCLRRKNELLESIDQLTLQQKRQQGMILLTEMYQDAWDRAKKMPDEFYAGAINAATSSLKLQMSELARMEKDSAGVVEQLNAMRLQEIKRYIEDVISITVNQAAKTGVVSDKEVFLDMIQENMVVAAKGIEG